MFKTLTWVISLWHNAKIMLKPMTDEDPPRAGNTPNHLLISSMTENRKSRALTWLKKLVRRGSSNSNSLQEVIEDYLEERKDNTPSVEEAENEKTFIVNVLKAHDMKVSDVMVPRADIVAISQDATFHDFKALFQDKQFSRLPVFAEDLDHIVGVLHIKDVLTCLLESKNCKPKDLAREVLIVTPGLPVMELFVMMREDKKHMAMVVDEHGGIDGLVTLNDIVEEIVGEIEDEFDTEDQPAIIEKPDGSIIADARVEIEEFEERYGNFLNAEEREDIQTLGGLAFDLAGRVPKRGETLKHASGLVLEVIDANASRVTRVRIRRAKAHSESDDV